MAASALRRTRWAVLVIRGTSTGSTPQVKLIRRQVSGDVHNAIIGIFGRWHATRRGVVPDVVAVTIAQAETVPAIIAVACPTAASRSAFRDNSGKPGSSPFNHACSARAAIVAMVDTTSTGNLPTADSPESMTASVPSKIAFATSAASARVGLWKVVIDSSICVAVITGTPA